VYITDNKHLKQKKCRANIRPADRLAQHFLWETHFLAVFVFCICPFFYICTEYHFSFGENAGFARHIPYQNFPFYNDLMTRLFALSTTEASSDAR